VRRARAVLWVFSFTGPRELAGGAWFVTADIRPRPGLSTWIVSDEAFETGGGIIIGVDRAARVASSAGDPADRDTIGFRPSSDGVQESRDCLLG
jgi:hypothetical protein